MSRWMQWWCRGCTSGAGAWPCRVFAALSFTERWFFLATPKELVAGAFWGPSVLIYSPCVCVWFFFPQLFCCLGALERSVGMEMLCLESSSGQGLFFFNNICRTMFCAQNLLILSGVFHCSSVKKSKLVGIYGFVSRQSQQHSS